MNPQTQKIYANALKYYGQHVTLNNNIPAEFGCAEAVSFLLKQSGIVGLPATGISGTATLYQWFLANPKFTRLQSPQEGCIIVSPTGYGNNTVSGHTGIVGALGKVFPGDYGIVSNDSQTGLLLELWNLTHWRKFYQQVGDLPVAFFLAN